MKLPGECNITIEGFIHSGDPGGEKSKGVPNWLETWDGVRARISDLIARRGGEGGKEAGDERTPELYGAGRPM